MYKYLISSNDKKLRRSCKRGEILNECYKNKFQKNINICQNYHWSNQKKKGKDIDYLLKIHNSLIKEIGKEIRNILNIKDKNRSWEILLSWWLWLHINFLYDRWEIFRLKKNNFLFPYIEFNDMEFVPYDTKHFASIIFTDDWNHWVYTKISLFLKFNKNKLIYKRKSKIKIYKEIKYFKFVPILKFISFFSSSKIFCKDMYFSKKIRIFFIFKFRQFRGIFPILTKRIKYNLNKNKREELFKTLSNDKNFYNFAKSMVKYNLPQSFFENFTKIKNNISDNSFLPINPDYICTAAAHHYDDAFKIYASKNIKSKFFLLQHGGSYGLSKKYIPEILDRKLSDKFFSWGWKNNSKKIISLFAQNYCGHRIKKEKKINNKILIPVIPFYKKPGLIADGRPRSMSEIDIYLKNIIFFLKNLNKENLEKIYLKFLDRGSDKELEYIKNEIIKEFKNIKIIKTDKKIFEIVDQYDLIIEFLNSTSFLEAIYFNKPVLMVWSDKYCSIRKESKLFFKKMIKNNIIFDDPKKASLFLNKNYYKLKELWNAKNNQDNIKNFKKYFVKEIKDPLKEFEQNFNL